MLSIPDFVHSTVLVGLEKHSKKPYDTFKRCMSGHDNKLTIEVTRWQWHKTKDLLHLYTLVGVIPYTLLALYCNLFIGPAQLAEIPEGYTPKPWEYERHPISRFIVRYLQSHHQQEYEKYLHFMYQEDEEAKMRKISTEIQAKMGERHDYQAYYYRPMTGKYFRITKEISDETREKAFGEN